MTLLDALTPNMPIPYGGNQVAYVSDELADAFKSGDRLVVVQDTGDLLHIPASVWSVASGAVGRAAGAFSALGSTTDEQVTAFYNEFAARLADDTSFARIRAANEADVAAARARGKSTTRLVLSDAMRSDMIAGLDGWAETPALSGSVFEQVDHDGWSVRLVRAGLGVVGFVFEGRPNVFADATGVLRAGNTVVFRIGSDALGTARAIVEHALDPAIAAAGLPEGAVSLVDSPARSAGWAMFSNPRLSLAVARGSGEAVAQLGSVARQAGIPVSLHGTGGAWIVVGPGADPDRLRRVIQHSLDRKVCNTLNTVCVVGDRTDLVPAVLDGLEAAAKELGTNPKLHVTETARRYVPEAWFTTLLPINRAEGDVIEPKAAPIAADRLGHEWEWEQSPEMTLAVVESIDEAVTLFNAQSPRFAASLIDADSGRQERFFAGIDSPFVGDGFTRWVDGQYALDRPELGLSNWQFGRLFARGGILSGDSVFTVRTRATQTDPGLHR
ncbi:MAG: aldehyde dehydrogenase family protein [Acidimicrobiia bacterium]|nr:aldehyde dehydrogenase family protein [Acidimicrobiia bacterium]